MPEPRPQSSPNRQLHLGVAILLALMLLWGGSRAFRSHRDAKLLERFATTDQSKSAQNQSPPPATTQKSNVKSAIPPVPAINQDELGAAYLNAYMMVDEANKLAGSDDTEEALNKLRDAAVALDRIRSQHPDWRPEVVRYRSRKIAESIRRLSDPTYQPQRNYGNPAPSDGSFDVGDIYLNAYLAADEASKLEKNGEALAAFEKYEDAAATLDQISRSFPGWQPEIVAYRRKLIAESTARVAQR